MDFDIIFSKSNNSKTKVWDWKQHKVTWNWLVDNLTNHKKINCTLEDLQLIKKKIDSITSEIVELKEEQKISDIRDIAEIEIEVKKLRDEKRNLLLQIDSFKDHGSFIPCVSKKLIDKYGKEYSSKLKDDVYNQTMLKIDIDSYNENLFEKINKIKSNAIVYSTFSHTTENPKVRIIVPLQKPLTINEFEYVSRQFVKELDLVVDKKSHEHQQIMYFPSCPNNLTPYTKIIFNNNFLDGSIYLKDGWEDDLIYLKSLETNTNKANLNIKKSISQKVKPVNPNKTKNDFISPLKYSGIRGDFNNACGNIEYTFDTFLGDIYYKDGNRYTLNNSSSIGGIILNMDVESGLNQTCWSNHANNDKIFGFLCDSYKLVLYNNFDGETELMNEWIKTLDIYKNYIQKKIEDGAFEIPQNLQHIFKQDIVNILAVGSGKTFSCGRLIAEKIMSNSTDLLIVATMSNPLINNSIHEVGKCLNLFHDGKIDLKNDNIQEIISSMGVFVLNSMNSMTNEQIASSKVIITNHAYFFSHGHTNNYNPNCYKIMENTTKNNRKIHIVYDEFDQFHKMGQCCINLNYWIGENLIDNKTKQTFIADHAFRYCHDAYADENTKKLGNDNFEDDFYYMLPKYCYKKQYSKDKEGIRHFTNLQNGSYDFETLILSNLHSISEKKIEYCGKQGKKVGNYNFVRYDEIFIGKIDTDVKMDADVTAKFLSINDYIIILEQKIEVRQEDLFVCRLETREDVIEFAKNNLQKKDWINYHNTLSAEGKNLYVKKMFMQKKSFNFKSNNYYVTATPAYLEDLGYAVDRSLEFNVKSQINEIDIFVHQNKQAVISDFKLMFDDLKKNKIETLAIINKKEVCQNFVDEHTENGKYSHMDVVIGNTIIDIGRRADIAKRNIKNITFVYQKGNQTQGTNYSDHILLLQDCHVKVSIIERLIPLKNGELKIIPYNESVCKNINQSALRILRGDKVYKSIQLYADLESEEINIIDYLSTYLSKYGVKLNVCFVKDETKMVTRKLIVKNILTHVNDRNMVKNLKQHKEEIFTYSNDFDKVQIKRICHDDFINFYVECFKNKKIESEIQQETILKFGITADQYKVIKKKNGNKIASKLM
ncbi:MAG: hypothetical protein ACRCW9_04050 [Cetobacterium sp.]